MKTKSKKVSIGSTPITNKLTGIVRKRFSKLSGELLKEKAYSEKYKLKAPKA
jgi:hypothetical protein